MLQGSADQLVYRAEEKTQEETREEIRSHDPHRGTTGRKRASKERLDQSNRTEHPQQKSVADPEEPTPATVAGRPLKHSAIRGARQHRDDAIEKKDQPTGSSERPPQGCGGSGKHENRHRNHTGHDTRERAGCFGPLARAWSLPVRPHEVHEAVSHAAFGSFTPGKGFSRNMLIRYR